MTRGVTIPLDSPRLVQQAATISCYICEEGNTFDAEFCRVCGAPMALAHQAVAQKIRPRMIAVVGGAAVGKTVYLGMLMDLLSRRQDRYQFLARGAFSITLQQMTIAALARCEFPQKTPNEPDRWNWVHCQIRQPPDRQPLELIMPDMAGEAVFEELDHPQSYPVIRALLEKCAGVMLLVDSVKLNQGGQTQDYLAMKAITCLTQLEDEAATATQRPVAIVFTKADQCDACMADPSAFAAAHAVGLWRQCRERLERFQFFAVGMAGACAWRRAPGGSRIYVPLRIEPHGVLEPFDWLVGQIQAQRPGKKRA